MQFQDIPRMAIDSKVKLTDGKYKGKTFRKESTSIWVQVWSIKGQPRPRTWMPIRLSNLDVMASRPEAVK